MRKVLEIYLMDAVEGHEEEKRRGGGVAGGRKGVSPYIGVAQPPVGTALAPTAS
jgi:hypothetical protein